MASDPFEDLKCLVTETEGVDPDLVIQHLRAENRHVMADLVEGLTDRIKELEHSVKLMATSRKGRKRHLRK